MTRRGIGVSLFVILLLVAPSAIQADSKENNNETPSRPQEVFLSFSYRNLFNSVIIAYYEDGQFYLPVSELLSLLKIPHNVSLAPPIITGSYLEPENSFRFNFTEYEASITGKGLFNFTASEMLIMELDFYITPEAFSRVFDLFFTINFNNLLLQLETPHHLPVAAEYERVLERERQKRYSLRQEYYPIKFERNQSILAGGFLDYSLSTHVDSETNLYAYNLNLGTEVLGGDLQGGAFGTFSSGRSNFLTENFRWRYVWRNKPALSQLSMGQMISDGPDTKNFTGLRVTNDPIEPRYLFDEVEIEGETVPGSEVELYFNNLLYDYQETSENGHYRFTAPLTYGSSRMHLKIYDPAGGILEHTRRIQIPFGFLPRGKVNYHLNIGRLNTPFFRSTEKSKIIQGDLSYGVTSGLTQKVGIEYLNLPSIHPSPLFYSSTSARLFEQYLVNIDAAPGAFYRLTGNIVYPSSASWNVGYTYFSGNSIYNIMGNDHNIVANVYLPFTILGHPLNIRLSGNHSIAAVSRTLYHFNINTRAGRLNFRLRYSDIQTGNLTLSPSLSSDLTASATFFSGNRTGIPDLLKNSFVRGQLNYNPGMQKLEQTEVQFSKTILRKGRLQISFARNFLGNFNLLSLGLMVDFNGTRSSTTMRNSSNRITFTQNFLGSIGYDQYNNNLAFSNRQQVGRAATAVRMFVDNNNSGTFDEGDEIIKDNAIRIGRAGITSINDKGIIHLTQLQAYNRINLDINKAALRNPLLIPAFDQFSFVADPNQFKVIDIPFYTSGIISGTVQRVHNGTKTPLPGLRLHLANKEHSFLKELRTFSDGTFYAYEIPPGTYSLEIDSAQLEFLDAVSVPQQLTFEVRPRAMGDFIENLDFEVITR